MKILATALFAIPLLVAAQSAPSNNTAGPTVLKQKDPDFGQCSLGKPGHAAALVALDVDAKGMPHNVVIDKTSGNTCFDNASVTAVEHYTFRPAARSGTPIASHIRIAVDATRY
ncbi:MAG: energy transducer TonB [Acidobacteria bacterium]|nr:energy transducer TonB [Acidobacteriota bacterium]